MGMNECKKWTTSSIQTVTRKSKKNQTSEKQEWNKHSNAPKFLKHKIHETKVINKQKKHYSQNSWKVEIQEKSMKRTKKKKRKNKWVLDATTWVWLVSWWLLLFPLFRLINILRSPFPYDSKCDLVVIKFWRSKSRDRTSETLIEKRGKIKRIKT